MTEQVRKLGNGFLNEVPWGTHLCQFYDGKEDLIDILVPYFKKGLENNEFCMWVTSEPLDVEDAKAALERAVGNLDDYVEKGQIEIIDYSQWYTKSGKFDADEVLQGWVDKENQAVKRGFDGLRLTGNTFWLEKEDWSDFSDYEAAVDKVIGSHRILAICSYALEKCSASELINVVANHELALVRQNGKWEVFKSAGRIRAEEGIRWLAKFPKENPDPVLRFKRDGTLLYANEASLPLLDTWGCQVGQLLTDDWQKLFLDVIGSGLSRDIEVECQDRILSLTLAPVVDADYVNLYGHDITERKRAEAALRQREAELGIKAINLQETNTALKVLLKRRDEDKIELEEKVLLNVKELVAPI